MAKVLIKPIEPLDLEFTDGTIKTALFNNETFVIYTDEFGKITEETLNEFKNKPYDLASRFLYCGLKVMDKDITYDEARAITVGGGEELAFEIMNCVTSNFMATADEISKKKFMMEIEKLNQQLSA